MRIEESGKVVEVRGDTALVRVMPSGACSGCAAAGKCHTGRGGDEQFLEAFNEIGAAVGDTVRVAIPAKALMRATAKRYLLPLAGLLVGAGVAQTLAGLFLPSAAGTNATGFGGIVGAILGILAGRRLGSRTAAEHASPPRITSIVDDVDSRSPHG